MRRKFGGKELGEKFSFVIIRLESTKKSVNSALHPKTSQTSKRVLKMHEYNQARPI